MFFTGTSAISLIGQSTSDKKRKWFSDESIMKNGVNHLDQPKEYLND